MRYGHTGPSSLVKRRRQSLELQARPRQIGDVSFPTFANNSNTLTIVKCDDRPCGYVRRLIWFQSSLPPIVLQCSNYRGIEVAKHQILITKSKLCNNDSGNRSDPGLLTLTLSFLTCGTPSEPFAEPDVVSARVLVDTADFRPGCPRLCPRSVLQQTWTTASLDSEPRNQANVFDPYGRCHVHHRRRSYNQRPEPGPTILM
jgi:hypothetical protein